MPILSRLKISNFRSIRELDLRLSPLTVLVGPNGAGKSTVLAALDSETRLWPTWRHLPALVTVKRIDEVRGTASLSEMDQRQTHSGHFNLQVQHLRLSLEALRRPIELNPAHQLAEDGHNLANLITTLPRTEAAALARELSLRIPGIADVDTRPSGGGAQQLRFHDRWSKTEFSPEEVSDGTLLMLAFLALRFQAKAPELITVEEPERGLHPYLLGELIAFLRGLTRGTSPIQVVLATHSAELLEHVQPEEVRFMSRSPDDGNVVVREADSNSPDWARFYREYDESLGSAWLAGGLGGVPNTH